MFACEHEGVEPDILLSAKGLGSGMPIGAMIAKESVTTWENGSHGATFGGNPVCCAAALATLDLVQEGLMANAARLGERLMSDACRLMTKHDCIGDVRGRGLMVGLEFVKNRESREPAPELVHELVQRSFRRGLLLLGAGRSSLRLAPPLVIDQQDMDTALGMIEGCTHLICFAAGHEIIRQRRRNLTLCRLTPDLIYDQMIAAGCARKLVFSWAGNPGAGSLHAFRRAVERREPPLDLEEYSHFGMVARLSAGAARLPFWTLRDYMGTDLPVANPQIRTITCPYTGETL